MDAGRFHELYGIRPGDRPAGWLPAALAFILRHAGPVLVAALALTALALWQAAQMPLVTDFAELLPEHTRSVVDQRAGKSIIGNTSLLVVLLEGRGDNAGENARGAAVALGEALSRDKEFTRVLYRFDRDFFETSALLYLTPTQLTDLKTRVDERIKDEVMRANPLYVDLGDDDHAAAAADDVFDLENLRQHYLGDRHYKAREYLVDDAGTTYLVVAQPVKPASDFAYNKRILEKVRGVVSDLRLSERFGPGLNVILSGNYYSTVEENEAIRRDLKQSTLISLLLLLLLIAVYFRRLRAWWQIFVPLLSSIGLLMGYAAVAVGRLNTITGFCASLFMGLAIDFAIHLLARYDEERGRGATVFDALLRVYRQTGKAAAAAGLTTAAGFLSLVAADFKGFDEFGVIAGGGMVIGPLAIAIELPAVIALSLRFAAESRFAAFSPERALARSFAPKFGLLLGACAAVFVALAVVAPRLAWEDDFRNLRGGAAQSLAVADRYHEILGHSTMPAVRITNSLAEARAVGRACEDERQRRGKNSTVQMCLSLADFIPDEQPRKLALIEEIRQLVPDGRIGFLKAEKRAKVKKLRDESPRAPMGEKDLPPQLRDEFTRPGGHYLVLAYPSAVMWVASNNVRFSDEMQALDDVVNDDVGPLGAAMIMADVMRVVRRDSRLVMGLAFAAVFAILIVVLRSVPLALASFLPLAGGLVATGGLMELAGMKLGFYNMVIIPSLIGMGVDNNVHMLHRYHNEGRGSLRYVVHTTGGACLMATTTTLAGFVGLSVADHQGLETMGHLAILGMTTCMLASLVALPAALGFIEARARGTCGGVLPAHEFNAAAALATAGTPAPRGEGAPGAPRTAQGG